METLRFPPVSPRVEKYDRVRHKEVSGLGSMVHGDPRWWYMNLKEINAVTELYRWVVTGTDAQNPREQLRKNTKNFKSNFLP